MSKKTIIFVFLLICLLALAACSGQEVAEEQVVATPDTAVATEDNDDDSQEADNEETTTTETADLPSLPALSGGAGGYGGGGGGVGLESSVAVEQPLPVDGDGLLPYYIENRLENAAFNLNTELPGLPSTTTVWQEGTAELSQEEMQEVAARFGFTGPIYTDPWFDHYAQENPAVWLGPRSYHLFDGSRTLSFFGASINYHDSTLVAHDPNWTLMPAAEARPVAEVFLNEHGLLDFAYEVIASPYGGEEVAFHRLVDGVPMIYPEITVVVLPDDQILSVYVQPFSVFTAVGDYPIIAAAEAWELAQTEPDFQRVMHNVYADPATFTAEPFLEPAGEYRYWQRTYQNGEEITLYTYPVVYTAVDGSDPFVRANEFVVAASSADLQLMADNWDQNIRLTGSVQGDVPNAQSIRVTSVEVVGNYEEWQSREGTVRYADGQVYLDTVEGEAILIPQAPDDLPDGERVYVNGPAIDEGAFLWTGIDKYVEYDEEPISIEPLLEYPTPAPITAVNIDEVELIYSPSYTYPEDGNGPGTTYMQLAWRFNGRTDTNEVVEIIVQAVAPEYLQTNS